MHQAPAPSDSELCPDLSLPTLTLVTPPRARRLPQPPTPSLARCAPVCPPLSGFFAMTDVDSGSSSGETIGRAATTAQAASLCIADSTCKFVNSLGYYRRVSPSGPIVYPLPGMPCLYTKCRWMHGHVGRRSVRRLALRAVARAPKEHAPKRLPSTSSARPCS